MDPNIPDVEALATQDRWLRALAFRLLRDEHAAEDAVQDAMAAALARSPREPRSLRAWLATVLRNLVFESRRSAARRREREERASRSERVPSSHEVVELEATRRRVVDALFALEEPWRETLLLRYHRSLPPRRIAAEMGVPVATVHTRLRRGLELLRSRLDAAGGARGAWVIGLVKLFPEVAIVTTGTKLGLAAAAVLLATLAGGAAIWRNRGNADAGPAAEGGRALAEAGGRGTESARAGRSNSASARTSADAYPKNPESAAATTGSLALRVFWGDDNSPAADVGVQVVPWGEGEPVYQSIWARSDATGRIRVDGITPGALVAYGDRGGNIKADVSAGRDTEAILKIPPGVLAQGYVVTPEGTPVSGATLLVFRYGNPFHCFPALRTGDDGHFSLRSVRPGHDLAAIAPDSSHRISFPSGAISTDRFSCASSSDGRPAS